MAKILKSGNKILKANDIWTKIDGPTATVPILVPSTSYLHNYIHQTGIFQMEFEVVKNAATAQAVIGNNYNAALQGFYITLAANNTVTFSLIGTGGGGVNKNVSLGTTIKGTRHILKIVGDGTYLYGYNNGVLVGQTLLDTLGIGNAQYSTIRIGYLSATYPVYLFIRNFKIWDNSGNLTHHLTMTDITNISRNVITGEVGTVNLTNVSVVNNLYDEDNWAYFGENADAALNSYAEFGTTSTLGWMNDGIFNIQFDLTPLEYVSASQRFIFFTALSNTQRGFMFIQNATNIQFYWCNGSAAYAYNANNGTITFGVPYHFTIQGNGTQIRVIRALLDGTVQNDSGWVACAYVPNATTTNPLRKSASYRAEYNLRNFQIFSDTAGTVPYLSFPLQNRETLFRDDVSGYYGVVKNVQIINNKTNVFTSKNLWAKFGSQAEGALGRIYPGCVAGKYNFIHQTGIFRIEFEWMFSSLTLAVSPIPFCTRIAAFDNGIYIFKTSGTNTQISVSIAAANTTVINTTVSGAAEAGIPYKVAIYGNGTTLFIDAAPIGSPLVNKATVPYTGVPQGTANHSQLGGIGGYSSTSNFQGFLRNVKVYSSTDTSTLVSYFPLQDPLNFGKDVVSNFAGTPIITIQPGIRAVEI